MKRLALLVLVGLAAMGGGAQGQSTMACSHSATLTVTPTHAGYWSATCRGNATVHVRVNGHDLIHAELSNHETTATFYGGGSVVRIDQRHGEVKALAQTTRERVRVRVWFTRAG